MPRRVDEVDWVVAAVSVQVLGPGFPGIAGIRILSVVALIMLHIY